MPAEFAVISSHHRISRACLRLIGRCFIMLMNGAIVDYLGYDLLSNIIKMYQHHCNEPTAEGCITREDVIKELTGRLDKKKTEQIHTHIQSCYSCLSLYNQVEEELEDIDTTSITEIVEEFFEAEMTGALDHPQEGCLDDETIRRYFSRQLSREEFEKAGEHLSKCSYCTMRAAEILD